MQQLNTSMFANDTEKPFSLKMMDKIHSHTEKNPSTSQHSKGKLFVLSLLLLSQQLLTQTLLPKYTYI